MLWVNGINSGACILEYDDRKHDEWNNYNAMHEKIIIMYDRNKNKLICGFWTNTEKPLGSYYTNVFTIKDGRYFDFDNNEIRIKICGYVHTKIEKWEIDINSIPKSISAILEN